MTPQKQLGKNLKRLREKAGLTQAEVGKKARIHVNYYARIERGETNSSLKILEAIAKALTVGQLARQAGLTKGFRGGILCR